MTAPSPHDVPGSPIGHPLYKLGSNETNHALNHLLWIKTSDQRPSRVVTRVPTKPASEVTSRLAVLVTISVFLQELLQSELSFTR